LTFCSFILTIKIFWTVQKSSWTCTRTEISQMRFLFRLMLCSSIHRVIFMCLWLFCSHGQTYFPFFKADMGALIWQCCCEPRPRRCKVLKFSYCNFPKWTYCECCARNGCWCASHTRYELVHCRLIIFWTVTIKSIFIQMAYHLLLMLSM
jgi:hypothetical protein